MGRKMGKPPRQAGSSGEYLYFERQDRASVDDYRLLCEEGPRLLGRLWNRIKNRLVMGPKLLLAWNMRVTLSQLAEGEVASIMEGGLQKEEYETLEQLHRLSTPAQLAAWELFNIHERQRLIETFAEDYRHARTQRSKEDLLNDQQVGETNEE